MIPLYPLRGHRFAPRFRESLGSRLAWDRDRLTPADTVRFHLRDPVNAIRLEQFPADATVTPGDRGALKAGDTWHAWLRDGVLWRDPRAAIYLIEQQSGELPPYRAFVARLNVGPGASLRGVDALDPVRQGEHLQQFKAAQHHAGMPLIGYVDHDQHVAEALLEASLEVDPDMVASSPDGIEHRMWILTDSDLLATLQDRMTGHELLVLAGAERLEAYRELVQHLEANGADAPLTMPAVFTDLEEPALRVECPHLLLRPTISSPPRDLGWKPIQLEGNAPDVASLDASLARYAPPGSGNLLWVGGAEWPGAWLAEGAHGVAETLEALGHPDTAQADDLHEVWVGLGSERFTHAVLVAPPRPVDLIHRTPAPPWRIQPRLPVGLVMAGLEE
ncbi:MAG: DUF1015 family protein [bacterium]|nr:DUF1015 family protein [bacterium]